MTKTRSKNKSSGVTKTKKVTKPKVTKPKVTKPKVTKPKVTKKPKALSKSKSKDSDSLEKDAPVVEAVYHEGGDSYRPIITISVPEGEKWISENIIYYRSSGRSNAGEGQEIKNKYRNGTWFPTIGLTDDNTPLIEFNKEHQNDIEGAITSSGYICKGGDIFTNKYFRQAKFKVKKYNVHLRPAWYPIFINRMYGIFDSELYKFLLKDKYAQIEKNETDIRKQNVKKRAEYLVERVRLDTLINDILPTYFNKWWQIQQSAQLGGGLWVIEPEFRDFVLNYKISEEQMNLITTFYEKPMDPPLKIYKPIDTSMVPTEYLEGHDNYKEIIAVTKENHAVNERLLYGEITNTFIESIFAVVFYDKEM